MAVTQEQERCANPRGPRFLLALCLSALAELRTPLLTTISSLFIADGSADAAAPRRRS